jgi:predicted nucleic acid-binding protein
MKVRPTIYLDTSAINFLYADDAPELKAITIDFFNNFVKPGVYQSFISAFVLQEINQTENPVKRQQLIQTITDYFIEDLRIDNLTEVKELAKLYIDKGIIPEKKVFDALHIATSVTHKLDYLVSWNYKHLANVNREKKIIAINTENNYLHPLRILTPLELIDYET